MYYVLLADGISQNQVLNSFNNCGIDAISHYVPLHSSAAGRRFGRMSGSSSVTDLASG
jgi:dTDP-4-amino-4,6-dideoxygalactose transaminase